MPKDRNGLPKQPKRHIRVGKGLLLLQVRGKGVLVKDKVVVSQDGSGNFTTINAAIAAAPNDSVAGSGYFMIYVTAGLYQEYVSIIS